MVQAGFAVLFKWQLEVERWEGRVLPVSNTGYQEDGAEYITGAQEFYGDHFSKGKKKITHITISKIRSQCLGITYAAPCDKLNIILHQHKIHSYTGY